MLAKNGGSMFMWAHFAGVVMEWQITGDVSQKVGQKGSTLSTAGRFTESVDSQNATDSGTSLFFKKFCLVDSVEVPNWYTT
jgi:hypothetical protein